MASNSNFMTTHDGASPLGSAPAPTSVGVAPQPDREVPPMSANDAESLREISSDVELFTRSWIARIRRLINRSAQLLERESLLAGALAKLDQQKSEWSKRTAERELALRDQAKMLTAAWLEVEAERRKSMQGGRVGASVAGSSNVNRAVSPVAVVSPVLPQNPPAASTQPPTSVEPAASVVEHEPVAPTTPSPASVPDASPSSTGPNPAGQNSVINHAPQVANRPILPGGGMSHQPSSLDESVQCENDAQSRQRIEEFKRMQRALRSNRNR
ncbi:hypothetical protein ACMFWY_26050 [Roseiconus sp. JC912]|uniref:hypothetical protein n=2 Tax=Pirellulaceae TaxID=2691357 RepID=UPI003A4C76D6